MVDLENKFHTDMLNIYKIAKNDLGYNATRLLQLISEFGGLSAAKKLITKEGGTYGFEILWERKRLDFSVEALVLKDEYGELFTEEEKHLCVERLLNFGYKMQLD